MTISANLQTEIARVLGRQPRELRFTLRPPLEIQSNQLHDLWVDDRHLIVKEYLKPDELESAPWREYAALQALSALKVAPQPVFYEPGLGPFVVYEYLPGEMWDRRPVTATDLSKLLKVWSKINAVPVEWASRGAERPLPEIAREFQRFFQAYLEWATTEFAPGQHVAELCLGLLEKRQDVIRELTDTPPVPCFCRADPRFANVIQRPDGRLGLVDWEDSGLRDPARDLADLVTHPNQEDLVSWTTWQAAIAPYLAFRNRLDATLTRRTQLYLAIFPFFWLMILTKRGRQLAAANQLAGWEINGLPGNLRLRRYLARALAWPEMDFNNQLERLETVDFFPAQTKTP